MDPSLLAAKIRARVPWCGLGRWPTPLERSDELARAGGVESLWLKREDRSAERGGGNKVRSLEFLLAGASPATVFVTVGATGSTHCLATAVHSAVVARGAVLAQFAQPETDASAAVRAAAERAARRVLVAPVRAVLPATVAAAWIAARAVGSPRWIPAGGASARGALGHLLGGIELAELAEPPDAVVVPLGSGGTAAGLMLAVGALGWPTRIVAARVAPRLVANRWRVRALARRTVRLLAGYGIPIAAEGAPLVLVDAIGGGYGVPTPEGETARRAGAAFGLTLDPTYGAKAFGALRALGVRGFRRVVFWHTFAVPAGPPSAADHRAEEARVA